MSVWVVSVGWAASLAWAEDGWEGHILAVALNNDCTVRTDRHYTSGVQISYLSADDQLPGWLARMGGALPAWGFQNAAQKWGVEIGQHVYTPEDLHRAELQVHDRPYAGWLYVSPTLQRRGPAAGPIRLIETVRFELGVTGPPSLAKEVQHWVHERDPAGWSHQLKTELGFAFRYHRRYRLAWRTTDGSWGADLLPHALANLGTVDVSLGAGAVLRAGYHLPNEFATGTSRLRWGIYGFTGVTGQWVLRNLFLDGNTFRPSHRVDRTPACGQFQAGLAMVLKPMEVAAAHAFLSPEFTTQQQWHQLSSLVVTVRF